MPIVALALVTLSAILWAAWPLLPALTVGTGLGCLIGLAFVPLFARFTKPAEAGQ